MRTGRHHSVDAVFGRGRRTAGGGLPEPSVLLARRLLWNRDVGGRPRPLPVVHLLGPWGAGKTRSLKAISEDCGSGIVHASFDFKGAAGAATTVDILAELARELSRKWRFRPAVRFTRFTLGWIAVRTPLDDLSREQARERLRARIDEITRDPRADRLAELIGPMVDSASKADPRAAGAIDIAKGVLPPLIKAVGRRPWRRATQWHTDIPEAEGAETLDALVTLNRRARTDPTELTALLTVAFLADVRANHSHMARADEGSRCHCDRTGHHWHNWVLLLDNVNHQRGGRFLEDMLAARRRHLRSREGDHDPLLLMATDGRWNSQWEPVWRPIWQREPSGAGAQLQRTVLSCRDAKYDHWAAALPVASPRTPHFPVRLEPLDVLQIAAILKVGRSSRVCGLVTRATGGLPAAVDRAAHLLREGVPAPGTRDVLEPAAPDQARADLWKQRLLEAGVDERLSAVQVDVDQIITAAPFATAPWLLSDKAISQIRQPDIGQILTELRMALWVTVPEENEAAWAMDEKTTEQNQATTDYAELHPWIARGLLSALVHRDGAVDRPTYAEQFSVLLDDLGTHDSAVREAYCRLALGRTGEVVSFFERWFDTVPHRKWVNGVKLVTRAPDDEAGSGERTAARSTTADLYHRIVDEEFRVAGAESPPIRNTITRLVVAEWLAANPFAVPDRDQDTLIAHTYRSLIPLSRRADVGALADAADAAESQWL